MTKRIGLNVSCAAWLICAVSLMTPSAHAQAYTVLYSFTGTGDGEFPYDGGSLLLDTTGNIYGTTAWTVGEKKGRGTVFQLSPNGQGRILDNFGSNNPDGRQPFEGLIADKANNLYSTTTAGGEWGWGTIFKLAPPKPGHGGWTETVLHNFESATDGERPGPLVIDNRGNLYGSAEIGEQGGGTVFKLAADGNFTVLRYFTSGADGDGPGGLALDPLGNIYGITSVGGINSCNGEKGCGVVFKLSPSGQETVLYSFTGGTDGGFPESALSLDVDHKTLYGTTALGGDLSCTLSFTNGCGVIFKLDAAGETVLYSFTGESDGAYPIGMIRDKAGNLYGSTTGGGDLSCGQGYGCGVLFKLDTEGNYTVLYTFNATDFPAGTNGVGGLTLDAAGNLYGVTNLGGDFACDSRGCGTVFELTNASR